VTPEEFPDTGTGEEPRDALNRDVLDKDPDQRPSDESTTGSANEAEQTSDTTSDTEQTGDARQATEAQSVETEAQSAEAQTTGTQSAETQSAEEAQQRSEGDDSTISLQMDEDTLETGSQRLVLKVIHNRDEEDDPHLDELIRRAFAAYRATAYQNFPAPPVATILTSARRRSQRRWLTGGLSAAAAIVVLAGSIVLYQGSRPTDGTEAAREPSPSFSVSSSPTPSPSPPQPPASSPRMGVDEPPVIHLEEIDLHNTTITLPAMPDEPEGCDGGTYTFEDGRASPPGDYEWLIAVDPYPTLYDPFLPEVNTIVTTVGCGPDGFNEVDRLVVLYLEEGTLTTFDYVPVELNPTGEQLDDFQIADSELVIQFSSDPRSESPRTRTVRASWNGEWSITEQNPEIPAFDASSPPSRPEQTTSQTPEAPLPPS